MSAPDPVERAAIDDVLNRHVWALDARDLDLLLDPSGRTAPFALAGWPQATEN